MIGIKLFFCLYFVSHFNNTKSINVDREVSPLASTFLAKLKLRKLSDYTEIKVPSEGDTGNKIQQNQFSEIKTPEKSLQINKTQVDNKDEIRKSGSLDHVNGASNGARSNSKLYTPIPTEDDSKSNTSSVKKSIPTPLDLTNRGVLKRGLIVFGGFALLGIAYFIFYRKSSFKKESLNTHNSNEGSQFRYGVLHSDDQADNMELSRMPLTMESDEDDDEDLEIFDLGQKKKSLSYINLKSNTDDGDLYPVESENIIEVDRDNLLLDIEDRNTLISINSNTSKSNSFL